MKKILNQCLKMLSKAVAATSLFLVSVSVGTIHRTKMNTRHGMVKDFGNDMKI